jgi:hypothetical protein
MKDRVVAKYLELYSEPEIELSKHPVLVESADRWHAVLCVPLLSEFKNVPALLSSVDRAASSLQKPVLLILLINQTETNLSEECYQDNLSTWKFFCETSKEITIPVTSIKALLAKRALVSILVIDRFSSGKHLPNKQGVGLARKVLADVACDFIAKGWVHSPWIYQTDGDALIPADYFTQIKSEEVNNYSSAIFRFQHNPCAMDDDNVHLASALYELYLHYYVLGLSFAKSPYAFYTIGSTIACHYEHYCAVRGFPKRKAGEDFYLLNKLAKTGKVRQLTGDPILLQGRKSNRVPFGTGMAIEKISGLLSQDQKYSVYHPGTFVLLKLWLKCAEDLCVTKDLTLFYETFEQGFRSSGEDFSSLDCRQFLQKMHVESLLKRVLSASPDPIQRIQHFHNQFDGFQTLKFVHSVRDHFLSPIDVDLKELESLNHAFENPVDFSP